MTIEPMGKGYIVTLKHKNGGSIRYGRDRVQMIMDLIEEFYPVEEIPMFAGTRDALDKIKI